MVEQYFHRPALSLFCSIEGYTIINYMYLGYTCISWRLLDPEFLFPQKYWLWLSFEEHHEKTCLEVCDHRLNSNMPAQVQRLANLEILDIASGGIMLSRTQNQRCCWSHDIRQVFSWCGSKFYYLSCNTTKPTMWHVHPAKPQISLGNCIVWSESSLCAQWVAKDPSFLHADSEDADQTGWMPRLIWVLAGRTMLHMPICWFCHKAAHLYSYLNAANGPKVSNTWKFNRFTKYLINLELHLILPHW